jgi:DNA mismatch endonuclease (patch repair protein)
MAGDTRGTAGKTRGCPGNTRGECKPEFRPLAAAAILVSLPGVADVFSKAKRSAVMSLIRGRGNKDTELRLIALFREHGISGWRRNHKLGGKPDFVFRKERLVVFVDGCFWHGCPQHATWPKQNAEFWRTKIVGNRRRDRAVNRRLREAGWQVVRIWEHALTRKRAARTIARIRRQLLRGGARLCPPGICEMR